MSSNSKFLALGKVWCHQSKLSLCRFNNMEQIFINLPATDLSTSVKFYASLGFSTRPLFSDEYQKCMVWSDQIYVMLMSPEKFKTYSQRQIPNLKYGTMAYFTLPVESLSRVNEIVENGLKAGGKEPTPMINERFMQIRKIVDLDGHMWDILYMDLSKFKKG